MKTSTEINSASLIVGEKKAVQYVAQAGFDAWDFSLIDMCKYDWGKKILLENKVIYLNKANKVKNQIKENNLLLVLNLK